MRAQLADRAARLRFLITYLHDNQLMARLSKTSKRHLAWDAERLSAASALWHLHNAKPQEDFDILAQAVEALNLPSQPGFSLLRSFFRQHVRDSRPSVCLLTVYSMQIMHLGSLFDQMYPFLERLRANNISLSDRTKGLTQIVAILVTTLQAIYLFRKENSRLYGTQGDQTCLSEPWSSRATTLQVLQTSCEETRRCLQDRTRQLGTNIDAEGNANTEPQTSDNRTQTSLKDHYAKLADYTLNAYQERLAYLQS